MADLPKSPIGPYGDKPEGETPPYTPTAAEQQSIKEVDDLYRRGRELRRPHERQWFINHSMDRGQQYAEWNDQRQSVATPDAPKHRVRLVINRIQAKVRARAAKFLKNRAIPQVSPATNDIDDRLNARYSTKALEYQWRRLRLETKYRDALGWANKTGHGYWWIYWDPKAVARIQLKDDVTGEKSVTPVEAGDVGVEVDGPWSLLVEDPSLHFIGDQPKILRLKCRSLDYVRSRFEEKGKYVSGELIQEEALRYEQQIATLSSSSPGVTGLSWDREAGSEDKPKTHVVVKEYFEKPCPSYPMGVYRVVANGVLLKEQEELPYGFADCPNPYPVVDFLDFPQVGQYWITTILEQLITPQREYNLIRSKLAEQLRLMVFPKLLAAKQHQIPAGAWTSEAGEFIEYFAIPHLPPPQPWHPPNIAADVWNAFELTVKEMDDISHIYPEAEGRVGESTSGFQTNLLQEATDQVHGPDIRAHEVCLEEAAYKIRRLMKTGYTVDRLLTVAGKDLQPEVFEFSGEQIDEYADVVIRAASALPTLPSARTQMLMEMWSAGVFGPVDDPEARRRLTSQLEMGTVEDSYDWARKDEEQAKLENDRVSDGQPLANPEFFENHDIHYRVHTDLLKSMSSHEWPPEQRSALIAHLILHVKFQNPQSAIQLAQIYQMPELVADLMPPPGAPVAGGAPSPEQPMTPMASAPPAPAGPPGPAPVAQPGPPGGLMGGPIG